VVVLVVLILIGLVYTLGISKHTDHLSLGKR